MWSIHVAEYDNSDNHVFAVDSQTWPSTTLNGEAYNYRLLRNATKAECLEFFAEHDWVVKGLEI